MFFCLLSIVAAENVQQTTSTTTTTTANDCHEYFQRQIVINGDEQQHFHQHHNEKWSGLIEFGVSRKQMWGFDITTVFLFDEKTLKAHGRPIINFELQKSIYHVLEDILEGRKVSINVTFPQKFQKSILTIVSIELDYQVICEDRNLANSKTKGELFSFDYKFKAPSEMIRKVSSEIEFQRKGTTSSTCGIPNLTEERKTTREKTVLDEDRLDSKTWPWIASLYTNDKYRCTVSFVTRSEAITASNCIDDQFEANTMRIEAYNNKNYRVRNVTRHNLDDQSITTIFLEDTITDPNFVPACLPSKRDISSEHLPGSVIGFERKFHEDYVVLNRINITTMSINDCIEARNGSILPESDRLHDNSFCGISKNDLTWLELDGLDGAGFYTQEKTQQWHLSGVIHSCLPINDTNDCDFDSPIIITEIPIAWLENLTLYHPLGLEPHQIPLEIHANANSMNILVILLILVITFVCLVGMWGLWYTCRKRNRPLISEVPSLISTNDGIQLLKRENKRFSYLN